MADPAAQRAYIKDISNAIPEFNGQKIHLQRFIAALMLVILTKGTFEDLAVVVVKSKIIGSTLYKVQKEATINSIIKIVTDVTNAVECEHPFLACMRRAAVRNARNTLCDGTHTYVQCRYIYI